MISNAEIAKEIKILKKNQKKISNNEISLVVLTCLALIVNLIFTVLVYFVFSNVEIGKNQWIYFGVLCGTDLIIITLTLLWFRRSNSNAKGRIPIPRSSDILDMISKIINIFNTCITLFTLFIEVFKKTSGTFFIFFSLQSIFTYAYWGWFIVFEKRRNDKLFMNKIKIFANFNFNDIDKYEVYINTRFDEWIRKYNENLYNANKDRSFKRRWKLFWTKFDWTGKKWEKNIIKNHELTSHNLELIFSDHNVTTYEEFCKYRFIILGRIFKVFYKETDENLNFKFKMFYWVRQTDYIKDFEKHLKEYIYN
ncbi:MAG: hypothetical protein LBQ45_02760 [Mycoplasmataceae bacterium]|nr:hypothetical protein [Mycoplasmataceae bacterium]